MTNEDILAAAVLIGIFVIPEIDAAFITPKIKESGLRMEIQCHDYPDKCWLQQKRQK